MQYKIELARAGMRDGPPGRLTSTERLQMLTSHLEAWRTLSWTKQETIPILLGDIWELVDSVFGMADGPRSMLLRQLPSQLRCVESREWKIEFQFDVEDFSIDPSQDLLLVIERCVTPALLFSPGFYNNLQTWHDPSAVAKHRRGAPIGCIAYDLRY